MSRNVVLDKFTWLWWLSSRIDPIFAISQGASKNTIEYRPGTEFKSGQRDLELIISIYLVLILDILFKFSFHFVHVFFANLINISIFFFDHRFKIGSLEKNILTT